jgi:tetratricopeptide (TPR) repeat protein
MTYAQQGDLDKAISRCDEKIEEMGKDNNAAAILFNLKGGLCLTQKNAVHAEEAYKTAIQKNPNFLPPYYALARIHMSAKRPEEAISKYQEILQKDPNQLGSVMLLGTIYEMQGQRDIAENHYRQALKIKPDFAPAANNLAYILISGKKEFDEALALATRAKEILPEDPNVMDTLGWAYYHKGFYDFAVMELTDASAKLDGNPTVFYHLGMAYYKKGRTEEARIALEKALSLATDFEGAEEARKTLSQF